MWDFAAFGFVALVWWTWPCIAACVLASVWLAMWSHGRAQDREYAASGPHPCLAHMGTDAGGESDHWCWQREGHDGQHINQWGVPQEDFDRPEEDHPDLFVGDPYPAQDRHDAECEWVPARSAPACDWSDDCPVHGLK